MPLKLIQPRQGASQNWRVRGTYLGISVDQTAGTPKRTVAAQELKRIEDEIERGRFTKRNAATWADAALAYVNARTTISKGDKACIRKITGYFGETPLKEIDQATIDAAATALYPDASAATRNRSVHTPCSAVLRGGGISLNLRRPKGAAGKKQTSWLWPEQTEALFAAAGTLNKDFEALLIVLTYTGMRLSEALGLEWNDVRLEDGYAYVPDTKNSEPRAVFLPPVAVAAMGNISHNGASRCFRFAKGGHIYSLLRAAAFRSGVNLPARSAFHILRHTYATWMRRYAGADETTLIATGAWKDAKSVKRYTHAVVSEESKRAAMLPTPKKRPA